MSLEKWVEYGWLKAEPSSPEEIRDLFSLIERAVNDARVEAISDDLRFQAAFSAGLTAANLALRASGYRTRVQTGHHQKIVESLEFTIQSDPLVIQKMRVFSKKRNATSYDVARHRIPTGARTGDPDGGCFAAKRDAVAERYTPGIDEALLVRRLTADPQNRSPF